MTDTVRTTVRLPSIIQHRIDSLALASGLTVAAVIRRAVEDFLVRVEPVGPGHNGLPAATPCLTRIALTTEFTQAAVDVLLRESMPEKRDEILLSVDQRMEQFHGKT